MKRKKIKALIGAILISMFSIVTAYGANYWGSYNSTYDMKGGIFTKKTFDVDEKMIINIYPKVGREDCGFSIYTYENKWYGYSRDQLIANVSSVNNSRTVSEYTGNYGIYIRNWSGFQCTGSINIQYK